jgi:hypothetical protein
VELEDHVLEEFFSFSVVVDEFTHTRRLSVRVVSVSLVVGYPASVVLLERPVEMGSVGESTYQKENLDAGRTYHAGTGASFELVHEEGKLGTDPQRDEEEPILHGPPVRLDPKPPGSSILFPSID